jgi:DNA invertase Pin-like site-specific DNA recombinase
LPRKSASYSQRTRGALKAAKARGTVLGNPRIDEARPRAVIALKSEADRFARNVGPIIAEITRGGVTSARRIAKALNARGVATARGGTWTAVQVLSIIARVSPLK